MSLQTEINSLSQKLESLKRQQSSCPHEFTEPRYNPYQAKEEYAGKLIPCGSDPYHETLYRDVTRDRWTRTCIKCGLEQHTETKKVVEVKEAPDFHEDQGRGI